MRTLGRTRHGLWAKYVDACHASWVLAGDYSPRTERILPRPFALRKQSFSAACCLVNLEPLAFGAGVAGAELRLDQRLIAQEAICHQAQFAAFFKMFG